jgi:PPM family protein phosphatase
MSLALRFAARSDVGLLREGNEDSGYAGQRLLAVADGMGGQAAGEVASSIVVATIAPLDDDVPGSELLDALAAAVEDANGQLRDLVQENPQLEGMGTTLTALLWAGTRLGLVHVGDSRAYLLRDGELQQITHDHTWVQRLVDEGRITEAEADHHPQRSLLMRAIDGRGNVDLDVSVREVRLGDRYLLCSDGLSGVVSFDTIGHSLTQGDPLTVVEALIDLALRGGGPDNITCIVADVVDVDSDPALAPLVVGAAAERKNNLESGPTGNTTALPTAGDPGGPKGRFRSAAGRVRGLLRDPKLRLLILIGVPLLILAIMVISGYRWSQTQYYVGTQTGKVAIYRGLSQQIFGMHLSDVLQTTEVPLTDLPEADGRLVEQTVPADNLAHAESIVADLRGRAEACQLERRQPKAAPVPRPGTKGAKGTPRPSPRPIPPRNLPGNGPTDCGSPAQ